MNTPTGITGDAPPPGGREETLSALFANMVIQQTNMAMMLLGKVPHPETGELIEDFEGARLFIDQLEMIEAKTRGNLSREEDGLLRQALTALRMAYVEKSGRPLAAETPPEAPSARPAPAPAPAAPESRSESRLAPPPADPPPPAAPEESRKKFTKKY
jgi:hypothetical protein